jgi:hypothetical protein
VAVTIAATGSFPSLELSGSATYADTVSERTYTVDTGHGTAHFPEREFRASTRWYDGIEWVFRPPDGSAVSLIFEEINFGVALEAGAAREEDPRPSPFEESA